MPNGGAPAERQAGWARLLSENELNALLVPHSVAPTVETLVAAARSDARETDPINEMLAAEIAIGLTGDMLVKVDRMSMANGLEVRCPFLDHRVVECAAAMPGEFKLAPGAGKRILRFDNASSAEPAVLIATYLGGAEKDRLIEFLPQ